MKQIPIEEAFDKFKPERCVFVISIDKKNKPNGMVAGWEMKCSKNPPLFAVSLSKKRNTHQLIEQSKEFVIAVPNKKLEKELLLFGFKSGKDIDKFEVSKIKIMKSKFIKSPLLKDATINLECKLVKKVDVGDHIIFVGEVLASYFNQNKKILFNMGKKDKERIFKEF
jgi:flavin reductase (DIM6/NTAB) family NADH-FMN oxidoreductase RutF